MEQNNFIQFESSKVIKEGFVNQFFFKSGRINPLDYYEKFPLTKVADEEARIINPGDNCEFPLDEVWGEQTFCLASQTVVVRIILPTGLRGFVIISRYEEDESAIPFNIGKVKPLKICPYLSNKNITEDVLGKENNIQVLLEKLKTNLNIRNKEFGANFLSKYLKSLVFTESKLKEIAEYFQSSMNG